MIRVPWYNDVGGDVCHEGERLQSTDDAVAAGRRQEGFEAPGRAVGHDGVGSGEPLAP